MPYKINGTTLALQPEAGKWSETRSLGIDGNGHPIYPAVREYELVWGLMSVPEFNELYNFFLAQGVTGTVVAEIPQYNSATYTYYAYTGCVMHEPTAGEYFETYRKDVKLLIAKVRV